MIYVVNINNKEYEVEVEKGKANLIRTTEVVSKEVDTDSAPTVTKALTPVAVPTVAPENSIKSGTKLEAPMPGTVVDIKVNVGDQVKRGQLLVILEAMKMENEIYAAEDGRVVQVLVSRGSSVNTNETMIVLN